MKDFAAKFNPFLSVDCARVEGGGAIQGKEGVKFCQLATLVSGGEYDAKVVKR